MEAMGVRPPGSSRHAQGTPPSAQPAISAVLPKSKKQARNNAKPWRSRNKRHQRPPRGQATAPNLLSAFPDVARPKPAPEPAPPRGAVGAKVASIESRERAAAAAAEQKAAAAAEKKRKRAAPPSPPPAEEKGGRRKSKEYLRRLIAVAKKLGQMAGVALPGGLEKKLGDLGEEERVKMNGEVKSKSPKRHAGEQAEEAYIDETLELLCGHFEDIERRLKSEDYEVVPTPKVEVNGMDADASQQTYEIEERNTERNAGAPFWRGRGHDDSVTRIPVIHSDPRVPVTSGGHQTKKTVTKNVSFGKTVSINRTPSFGSDSVYESVSDAEEVDGDVVRPVRSVDRDTSRALKGNDADLTLIADTLDEYDAIDSDEDTFGKAPLYGEGEPNQQSRATRSPRSPRSPRPGSARRSSETSPRGRRLSGRRLPRKSSSVGSSDGGRARRDSVRQRESLPMVPGKKPSFHLDFASAGNSYVTNISSRKSLEQSPTTIREQQEQLHRDYLYIFGSDDDTFVPQRTPGVSMLRPAGGELYTDEPLSFRWTLGREIGKGTNASVRMARRVYKNGEMNTGEPDRVAVKVISKKNLELYNENMIAREVFCFRLLGVEAVHENIVELYEICEDESNVYLVMEMLEGGELFTRISERGQYTEKDAANLVVAMLSGLNFCHRRNVIHRDVKPENFVFARPPSELGNDTDIKLTDFGIAHYSENPNVPCKTLIGTPLYMAPEVLLQQGYGTAADLWSLGVIVYIMLAGYPPFDDNDLSQLIKKIKYRPVKFVGPEWVLISEEGKHFLTNLLDKDPSNRMSAQEALEHEWLRNNCHAATKNLLEVAQINIKSFVTKRRWKAAIQGVKAMNRMQKMIKLARAVSNSEALNSSQELDSPTGSYPESPGRSASFTRKIATRKPPDDQFEQPLTPTSAAAAAVYGQTTERRSSEGSVVQKRGRRNDRERRSDRQHWNDRQHSNVESNSMPFDQFVAESHDSGSLHWKQQARLIRGEPMISVDVPLERKSPSSKDNRPRVVKMGDPGTSSIHVNDRVVIRPQKRSSGLFHFCFK